jgi:protein TonB
MKPSFIRSFVLIAGTAVGAAAGAQSLGDAALADETIVIAAANLAGSATGIGYMPSAVSRPLPEFPVRALLQGVHEGSSLVRYTVAADGTVGDVEIVQGTPYYGFNRNAQRAVSQWRFEPTGATSQRSVQFVFVAVP